MTHYKIELNLAAELVKTATDITEWFRVKGFESFQKEDESPVTLADYASQLFIVKKLREKFPNDQIIAEESYNSHIDINVQKIIKKCYSSLELDLVEDFERNLNYRGPYSPRQWTVDPIDGTKGFQKNLTYAIGIGFMINSELIAAAIGVPNYNEKGRALFIAEKNQGARVSYGEEDFTPIRVTDNKNIKKAKMCHSLHYDEPWVIKFAHLAEINKFIQKDSMAKFCMVADGTADLYIKPFRISTTLIGFSARLPGCRQSDFMWQVRQIDLLLADTVIFSSQIDNPGNISHTLYLKNPRNKRSKFMTVNNDIVEKQLVS